MAISTTASRISYAGNGVTTVFSFPYVFLANGDLKVIEKNDTTGVETVKTLTTHYTVSGGSGAVGSVTMLTAPAAGVTLVLYDDPDITQGLDLLENDPAPAESMERAWDRLTLIAQRLKDRIDRAVRMTDGYAAAFTPTLPAVIGHGDLLYVNAAGTGWALGPTLADRISKFLAFDASGDPIAAAGVTAVPVSTFMGTVLDDTTAAAALTTLGASAFIQTVLDDTTAAEARTTLGANFETAELILANQIFS